MRSKNSARAVDEENGEEGMSDIVALGMSVSGMIAERENRPWIERQQKSIKREMSIAIQGWKYEALNATDDRIKAEAQVAALTDALMAAEVAIVSITEHADKVSHLSHSHHAGAGEKLWWAVETARATRATIRAALAQR
jgi:hypothetical protein